MPKRKSNGQRSSSQSCVGCGLAWCGPVLCPVCDGERNTFVAAALTGLLSKISAAEVQAFGVGEIQCATVVIAFELADRAMAERRKRL